MQEVLNITKFWNSSLYVQLSLNYPHPKKAESKIIL